MNGWWTEPAMVTWSRLLLTSFRHWTRRELIDRKDTAEEEATTLFEAPFIVVSHGPGEDPVLNYGNRLALELWDMTWEQFARTPSRLTAEPINRPDRDRMLARARQHGFIDDYRGVRISVTGRRFLVEDAIVWTVLGSDQARLGQAATFTRWTYL